MNDNTPLEQFSALDDWAPAQPVWRPYVPKAESPIDSQAGEAAWAR